MRNEEIVPLSYGNLIKSYARRHPCHVVGTFGLAAIRPVESLITPTLMGRFGAGIAEGNTKTTTRALLGLGGLNLLTAISFDVDHFLVSDTAACMRQHVCSEVMHHRLMIEKNKLSEDVNNASQIQQVNSLSNAVVFYNRNLLHVIPSAVSLVTQTIYLSKIDSLLAGCMGLMLAGAIGFTIGAHAGCRGALITQNEDRGELTNALDEILTHRISIIEAGQIEEEISKLRGKADVARKSSNKAISKSTIFSVSLSVVTVLSCVMFLLRLNRILENRRGKIGTTKLVQIGTSSLSTLLRAIDNINRINDNMYNLAQRYNELTHLLNVVNEKPIAEPQENTVDLELDTVFVEKERIQVDKNVALQLLDVSFSYHGGDNILNQCNVKFEHGKTHIITGCVGGGKSTILKLLAGFIQPVEGTVCIRGYPMSTYKDTNSIIGFVPQVAKLFSRSLYENIVYGNQQENITEQKVNDFLEEHSISFGSRDLNTSVGKNGSFLSGGQRQLVLLLRLLFRNTQMLLLDEPSSSVDTELRQKMVHLLDNAVTNDGKTVVIVSHDIEFIKQLQDKGAITHDLDSVVTTTKNV